MKLIKEAANARTVQNENKNYTFHLGKVAPQRPPRAFPSSFSPFCISIPAKQHKGIKKTAKLHKSLPVLLVPFQHAQNSPIICIT
jgi:hypothetical protein